VQQYSTAAAKLASDRRFFDREFGETSGRRLDNLQFDDRGVAQPLDFAQPLGARRYHLGERAEAGDESLGERLDITPRHGAEKNELEQFILAQGIGAAFAEPVAQPLPVAEVMRRVGGGGRFPFRHTPFNPATW